MTKLTFANGNVIVVEGYKIGNALPAKAPSLKEAAQIAVTELDKGSTPDAAVTNVRADGEFLHVSFQNGALLTLPADHDGVCCYKQALEIVVQEIED